MKIDIFTHITPERYLAAVCKRHPSLKKEVFASMTNDSHLRAMERTPEVLQVLTSPPIPPIEAVLTCEDQIELTRIANDEMAEMVVKYPDKFLGAVAFLPLQDMNAALEETDRAITQLGFKGVLIVASLFGEQLDDPKYRPLYAKMAHYDLPIWIHPGNSPGSNGSPNPLETPPYGLFGWPMATSNAMLHLVTSGIFDEYPDIKFITHHCGGIVPMLEGRVKWLFATTFKPGHPFHKRREHLKKFYNDTATMGSTAALMCSHEFFGTDHLLFGTDGMVQETINSINKMAIPEEDKQKIFYGNAIHLLNLRV